MLQNAYLLAKIGADTTENERNFGEILPQFCNYPYPTVAQAGPRALRRGRPNAAEAVLGGADCARGPVTGRGIKSEHTYLWYLFYQILEIL